VVTDPPPVTGGAAEGAAPPPAAQAQAPSGDSRGAMSLYVYPKNGQGAQQTANDRYQCHQWAVAQTGFDPTNSANDTQAATATPENYKRAVTACLEARGYSVR
jgi:beta-lactamase class A